MPDEIRGNGPHPDAVLRASQTRRWRFSLVWVVPIVAVAIGIWLAWDTLHKRGPNITVSFQSGEGLQVGQSQLRFKDIVFGTVSGVRLTPDRRRVNVDIATTREATPLLTEGAEFWVVKPRLFAGSLSGLDTLLSGAYVALRPAANPAPERRVFVGLEDPPVLESETPGRVFLLKADRLGSISLGSPIFYRDLQVGEVLGWDIGDMARTVTIRAFIRAPFDQYVHENSHFWNASGVNVKLGAAGVEVQVESLRAVLLGGIAFDTPVKPDTAVAAAERPFRLYANQDAADNASEGRRTEFVAFFQGSVRGLAAGADVTLHGLKIGTVTGVDLTYDPVKDTIIAPVRFEVQAARFTRDAAAYKGTAETMVQEFVDRGLRATLQSANLLTGQMLIALDFFPDQPHVTVAKQGDVFVLPTMDTGGFSGLEAGAAQLLAKLNTIPFDQIGRNLNDTLAGASGVANDPELKRAVASLSATLETAQETIRKLDAGVTPAMRRLPEISDNLQKATAQASKLIGSLDSAYGDNTRFNRDLERLLSQATEAVSSIRSLSDLLTRHPEALIRGRTDRGTE
jgi:paraquat-inducible protein B